jgi:hypothetical protein
VTFFGGTCGYRFEKDLFRDPPSHSIQSNISKRAEEPPARTSGSLFS